MQVLKLDLKNETTRISNSNTRCGVEQDELERQMVKLR